MNNNKTINKEQLIAMRENLSGMQIQLQFLEQTFNELKLKYFTARCEYSKNLLEYEKSKSKK